MMTKDKASVAGGSVMVIIVLVLLWKTYIVKEVCWVRLVLFRMNLFCIKTIQILFSVAQKNSKKSPDLNAGMFLAGFFLKKK